jgi:hypothetical protein
LEEAVLNETTCLKGADLAEAILNGVNFSTQISLTGATFCRAELRRANLGNATLRRTNLREADLQNANLENANFLLTRQLAGADVTGAKLPNAIAEFKGLETIAEPTSHAKKLFVAIWAVAFTPGSPSARRKMWRSLPIPLPHRYQSLAPRCLLSASTWLLPWCYWGFIFIFI